MRHTKRNKVSFSPFILFQSSVLISLAASEAFKKKTSSITEVLPIKREMMGLPKKSAIISK